MSERVVICKRQGERCLKCDRVIDLEEIVYVYYRPGALIKRFVCENCHILGEGIGFKKISCHEGSLCKKAVDVYGPETQTMMLIEEMGELMQAISKHKRFDKDTSNIAEEIVDVEIMLEQAKHIYKVHQECERWHKKKMNRLAYRLEGGVANVHMDS